MRIRRSPQLAFRHGYRRISVLFAAKECSQIATVCAGSIAGKGLSLRVRAPKRRRGALVQAPAEFRPDGAKRSAANQRLRRYAAFEVTRGNRPSIVSRQRPKEAARRG